MSKAAAAREELTRLGSQLAELRRELDRLELRPIRDRVENKLIPTLEGAQEQLEKLWECPLCHGLFPQKVVDHTAAGAGIPCPLCAAEKRLEKAYEEGDPAPELGEGLVELLEELELFETPASNEELLELCREGLELLQKKQGTPAVLWSMLAAGEELQQHSFRSELASVLQAEISVGGELLSRSKAFELAHKLVPRLQQRAQKHRREKLEQNTTFKLGRGVLEAVINEGLYEVEEAPGWEELLGLVERALELYRKQPGLVLGASEPEGLDARLRRLEETQSWLAEQLEELQP